jgi:SAM-dependent methyltransferase
MSALAQFKQGTRTAWAAEDYHAVARNDMWQLGERIVRRAGVRAGEHVLDVACGTGNAAIRAAQAGARVIGLDLTPELFEAGRREAAQSGVQLEWIEGDAEEVPFDDETFDVVLSTFGAMFAPRHAVAAHELARVLRPGGRLAMFNWTRNGGPGEFYKLLSAYVPPAPDFASPPLLWGDEEHVRELFADTAVELSFDREIATNPLGRFATVDERIEHYTSILGPMIMLRRMTEARGRWPQLRADLERLYAITDERADGEYLVVLGRKARGPSRPRG